MSKAPARRLEAFLDFTCPYSRLTFAALVRAGAGDAGAEAGGVPGAREVTWRPFELYPEPAAPREPDEPIGWREAAAERIAELGLRFGELPAERPRTRKAHEAALFADAAGRGQELRAALFRAYWEEGRDIARVDVLVELGEAAGLDPFALKVALDIDQAAGEVEAARAEAEELGIGGTPVLVLREEEGGVRTFAGAASPREIREFLEDAGGGAAP